METTNIPDYEADYNNYDLAMISQILDIPEKRTKLSYEEELFLLEKRAQLKEDSQKRRQAFEEAYKDLPYSLLANDVLYNAQSIEEREVVKKLIGR